METAGFKILPERCASIRWKGMFIDSEWDPTVPRSDDGPCWCLRTQTCLGPDGQVVDQESCNRNRSCYERL